MQGGGGGGGGGGALYLNRFVPTRREYHVIKTDALSLRVNVVCSSTLLCLVFTLNFNTSIFTYMIEKVIQHEKKISTKRYTT